MAGAFHRFANWAAIGDNAFGLLLWASAPPLLAVVIGGFF